MKARILIPLTLFCLSLPGYALSVSASFWMEGLSRPGPGAWGMWIANGINLALDLILKGLHGRLVVLKNGRYDNVPLDVVTGSKKVVNVGQFYNTERYRPKYESFEMKPLFIMTSEG